MHNFSASFFCSSRNWKEANQKIEDEDENEKGVGSKTGLSYFGTQRNTKEQKGTTFFAFFFIPAKCRLGKERARCQFRI
jgi:hypothetical protein